MADLPISYGYFSVYRNNSGSPILQLGRYGPGRPGAGDIQFLSAASTSVSAIAVGDAVGLRVYGITLTGYMRVGGVWTQYLTTRDDTIDRGWPGILTITSVAFPGDNFSYSVPAASTDTFPASSLFSDAFSTAVNPLADPYFCPYTSDSTVSKLRATGGTVGAATGTLSFGMAAREDTVRSNIDVVIECGTTFDSHGSLGALGRVWPDITWRPQVIRRVTIYK